MVATSKTRSKSMRGNKNAKGHGRPRVDYRAEAILLDEWSKKSDSTCIYQFTFDKKYLAQQLSQFAKEDDYFSLALIKAKERIANNRLKLLNEGEFNQYAYGRSAAIYDKILRDHEDEEKNKDSKRDMKTAEHAVKIKVELEKENNNTTINPHLESLHQLLAQNKALQDKINALESKTDRQLPTSDP